jgi:4-amino-4-deoxy-L-arabinose transferase-like glycosyltransferase
MQKIFSKKPISFWLLLPLALYLFFAVQHITKFETADEHFWFNDPAHDRIHQYWNAIAQHDWISTRINDKPGVSLALVSGVGILLEKNVQNILPESIVGGSSHSNPQKIEQLNFMFRFPQVLLTFFALLYFFWALRKITKNELLSLFIVGLMALSPILIGISQIVNPDSLLWIFSFAAVLTFFLYLQELKKWQAVLTAIFFGLALLSKYAALMIIPFFFASIFFHALFNYPDWNKEEIRKKMLKFSQGYFVIVLMAFAIFSILMPAVFVNPILAYKSTIGFKGMQFIFWPLMFADLLLMLDAFFVNSICVKYILERTQILRSLVPKAIYIFLVVASFVTLANWVVGNNLLGVVSVAFDSAQGEKYQHAALVDKLILQFRPIVFSLTPIILLGVLFLWIKAIFKKIENELLVFLLTFFMVVFYLAVMKQGLLITIRYGIILYPVLTTLGALGIYEMLSLKKKSKACGMIVFLSIILISLISIWNIKPYYFNYTNFLLPKNNIITGAWGYGGYEAAQYLNKLPGSANMTVWSDYYGLCPFFVGKCIQGYALKDYAKDNSLDTIDYVIATRRGKIQNKNVWKKFKAESLKNVWMLEIDGRSGNYIKISQNIGKENASENE